jgi:hypothetical protein
MSATLSIISSFILDVTLPEVLDELMNLLQSSIHSEEKTDLEQSGRIAKYSNALSRCDDFQDIFVLVKKSVRDSLGQERRSIVLQLLPLPLHIGAAHPVGTNRIVLNAALLELAVRNRTISEVKAFVFSTLLHEYIHSLGYLNEYETRKLVFLVSQSAFGPDHLVTQVARYGPWYIFRRSEIT